MSGILTKDRKLLSQIAIAALTAKSERVDKAQVNKLLEVLNSHDIDTLLVYIARQVSRGEIGKCTGRYLVEILSRYKLSVEEARMVLGYFKWLFESLEKLYIDKFREWSDFTNCKKALTDISEDAYLNIIIKALS